MSFLHIDMAQVLKMLPQSKTITYLFYIVNIMGADVLATQGGRASGTMILTTLNSINSVPARQGLKSTCRPEMQRLLRHIYCKGACQVSKRSTLFESKCHNCEISWDLVVRRLISQWSEPNCRTDLNEWCFWGFMSISDRLKLKNELGWCCVRDHSVHGFTQWETTLHLNIDTHWLSP